jgi:hypothetical protein
MFIKIQDGQPVETTLKALREADPNVSFRADYPDEQINPFGIFRVETGTRPEIDHQRQIATLSGPVFVGGIWQRVWEVADRPIEDRRAKAELSRAAFCMRLLALGILPAAEAVTAARGEWPGTFGAAIAGLPEAQAAAAQIEWATSETVRYGAPSLQGLALMQAGGDAERAMAILDAIFEVAA